MIFKLIVLAAQIACNFYATPGHTGRWKHTVTICYQTCEYDILKKNETILMPIGTSGPWGKDMQRSTSGVRRSNVKVIRGQR